MVLFVPEMLKWQPLTSLHLTLPASTCLRRKVLFPPSSRRHPFSKCSLELNTVLEAKGSRQCARCWVTTREAPWKIFWAFKNKWNKVRVCLSKLSRFTLKWVTFLNFSSIFDISLDVISAILKAFYVHALHFIKLLSYSKTYLIKTQFYGAYTNYYSWLEGFDWTYF